MLEMSFPHYMYTYVIEALKPQPSLQELKKINMFKKFYLIKRKNTFLLSQKEGTGKEGDCQKG